MNLGAADVDDDGEIDREEFARIMNFRETTPDERRAAFRREIARQARAAEEAEVVAQMLGEYGVRGAGSSGKSELRRTLRDIFASIAGPGFSRTRTRSKFGISSPRFDATARRTGR